MIGILLSICLVQSAFAQRPRPQFLQDNDQRGFIAMTDNNLRAFKQKPVYAKLRVEPLKGPKAKVTRIGPRVTRAPLTTRIEVGNSRRTQLKGPRAKNYKPWKKK